MSAQDIRKHEGQATTGSTKRSPEDKFIRSKGVKQLTDTDRTRKVTIALRLGHFPAVLFAAN